MTTIARTFTTLNRNEYAMGREDDFAQTAAVRNFCMGKQLSETELFRLGISPDEPYRTITFTDDTDDLEALASQSTKSYFWVGYADGMVIAKEPASRGSYGRIRDALNGYVATQRIIHGHEPEGVTMDRVNAHHLSDLPDVPMSNPCGDLHADPTLDRLPRDVRWIDGEQEDDPTFLPYVEGVSEAAALGYRASINSRPTCD